MFTVKVSDPRVTQEYRSGARISFAVAPDQLTAAKMMADELRTGDISLDCRKWRQKRSYDANSYLWVLVDKIASKTCQSPEDVYRHAIKDIAGNSTIVCVQDKAKEILRKQWEAKGIGWQVDDMGPAKNTQGCSVLKLYYGSSVYDTAQMSALIDRIVDDAKELGIQTMTPFELEGMKEAWR